MIVDFESSPITSQPERMLKLQNNKHWVYLLLFEFKADMYKLTWIFFIKQVLKEEINKALCLNTVQLVYFLSIIITTRFSTQSLGLSGAFDS